MIPQEKSAAVSRGLQEAFGNTTIDNISRMTRGLSSDLVFRIIVSGSPYLLRIMTRINEQMDPRRIFASMIAASDAGITPHVHYTNVEDGISITDFIEPQPLSAPQALHLLPQAVRRLHSLAPFPKEFNYLTAHKGFVWRFRGAGLLSQNEIDEAFSSYDKLCSTYPRLDEDMVSSHMDLKPDKILFDGGHIWLVDWQAAFVNDRYFDLAVAANCLVNSDDDEAIYLERYFGHAPDEYQRCRFFLMRQFLHIFSASVFLMLGSGGQPMTPPEHLPSFEEFHRQVWAGEVNLADKAQQIVCGLVHWKQLLNNIRLPRFEEALKVVSRRNPPSVRKLFPAELDTAQHSPN
ncbi:MAG: phosphotransferase [Acidobacteria bacterium]|nr:phosphotransferase [Acidobacteriota bacterium]